MLQLINPSSPVVPTISPSSSIDGSESSSLKKPLRPLTAYHIFFQIEREYIIQTTHSTSSSVGDNDPNKSVLCDVPDRYRNIKLLPDWYAGPGKRQKRKHRKSHGMIGFLELSRVISQRWANLETEDMETKQYVTKIAKQELEEYKAEMKEYKLLTGMVGGAHAPATVSPPPKPKKITVVKKVKKQTKHALSSSPSSAIIAANPRLAMISPSSSPRPHDDDDNNDDTFITAICGMCNYDVVPQKEEIDYSICTVSHNGNYMPSPSTTFGPVIDSAAFDPLFELDNDFFSSINNMTRRSVSEGGDDDFLQLLADI